MNPKTMRVDKAKIVDEVWDEAKIASFLDKGPMGKTPQAHSKLLYAYRSMCVDDFGRFVTLYKQKGGDVNARDASGRTLLDIVSHHKKSAPFQEILRN